MGVAAPTGVVAATRDLAPALFMFLVDSEGFDGPELLSDGVAYHRAEIHVVVAGHEGREPEVTTVVEISAAGAPPWRARLGSVYVAAELGPAQDVPESARNQRIVQVRLKKQADALQELLQVLDDASLRSLVRVCHGT